MNADGMTLWNGPFDVMFPNDGVSTCAGGSDGCDTGDMDGTVESKLNASATIPILSRTLPSLILWKQHGSIDSPPGDSMIRVTSISNVSATSTY
jgi:hypothetical protein